MQSTKYEVRNTKYKVRNKKYSDSCICAHQCHLCQKNTKYEMQNTGDKNPNHKQ
jgi:hypothetical protein